MGKAQTLLGQLVEMRSLVERVSVTPEFGPSQIVCENENDVGFASFSQTGNTQKERNEQNQEVFHHYLRKSETEDAESLPLD